MFLFAVVIFYINALQICTTSDSVNSLLKYKIDLDRIGNDVENFFYDLTKDVLKKSEKFGYDYETDDEEEEKETIKNKIIKQKMKFNTTPSPINVIEDYTDTNNERKRRSIISEENFSAAVEKPNCNPIVFEDESLQDIKVEVKKLTEITRLLRDQQKILSKLNNSNDFSGEYDPQDILNMLQNFVKNREIAMPKDEKFKNLDKLKTEIHKAILALNQTNDVWKGEKQTELNMEKQIKQQKNDIDGLKKVVEQLLHQTKEKENGNVNMTEEIVGLPLFLTHPLQSVKKHSEQKIEHGIHFKKTNDSNIPMNKTPNVQIHQEKQEPPIKTESINKTKTEEIGQEKARSSSVEKEISKLFDTVEEPSKINLEDELEELEDKLNTVSKQKNLKKALLILRKLLKKEKKEKPAAKSLLEVDDDDSDDEDVVFLKRLQTAINVINSESGKTVPKQENEIEKRLKELQIAIDRLRPKDQFEADETNGAQKKGLPEDVKADKEPERLTVNQLKQLRNKIDELLRVEEGRKLQNKPITSSGINYDSPIMNFDSKKPLLPYPFWYRGPMGLPPLDYYGQHSPLPIDAGRLMPNDNPKYFDPQEVDMRSQFFQAPQFFPSGTSRELNYYPEDSIGYIVPQSGHYTTALDKNDFKKISKVNELKTEIYNLENILSTIDSTPYGDKSELTQLEQQIKDLKVIINSLTADKVPYLQPPISKTNYRSTRPKRSIEEYDDITSMLKKYVLEEEHKDRSSHYDELRKRLDKIRTQKRNLQ